MMMILCHLNIKLFLAERLIVHYPLQINGALRKVLLSEF